MKWILAAITSLMAWGAFAQAPQEAQDDAFIKINMTLELDGIEHAIQDTRQSLDQIGVALNNISQTESFNEEQQQLLTDTVDNLNQLVVLSKQSVASLPEAFEYSRQTVATESQRFLDDLRTQVLLAVAAVGFIVIAIIAAIAWLILRPMQEALVRATQNISSMAGAIKTTAQALDSISNQQQEIAKQLEVIGETTSEHKEERS